MLAIGDRIGSFVVDAQIGQGATGAVFRARHVHLDVVRAIKVAWFPARVHQRTLREGALLSRLNHPNVVGIIEMLLHNGHPALVLECVDGPNLEDHLYLRGKLPFEAIDAIAEGLMAGLEAMHAHGIVHRDLKPANVLLVPGPDGFVPRIADFGVALLVGSDLRLTGGAPALGTPQYQAPEQHRDPHGVDGGADLFSLGCVLYELITGSKTFPSQDRDEIARHTASGQWAPVSSRRSAAPSRMVDAVRACLQPQRADRPADCAALRRLWRGEGTMAFTPVVAPSKHTLVACLRVRTALAVQGADPQKLLERVHPKVRDLGRAPRGRRRA